MKVLIATIVFLIAGLGSCSLVKAEDTVPIQDVDGGSTVVGLWSGSIGQPDWNGSVVSTITNGWTWYCNNCTGPQTGTVVSANLATVSNTNDWMSVTLDVPSESGMTYVFYPPGSPNAPNASQSTLCCGASAAQFSANPANVLKSQNFYTRSTQDTQVYINQIGNSNTTTVNQQGTQNNYAGVHINGSNNTTSIVQQGAPTTQVDYVDLTIVGNNNTANINQISRDGAKGAFVSIRDNNNSLTLNQTGNGSHYADVTLTGGNKTVDITQEGPQAHQASITLTGLPSSLNLLQTGTVGQSYSIQFNCATAGGCAPISVTQGR